MVSTEQDDLTRREEGESDVQDESVRGQVFIPFYPGGDENSIRIADLLEMVVRYRLTILIIVTVTALVSFIIAFALPPVYRAEVLLSPIEQESSSNPILSFAGQIGDLAGFSSGGTATDEAIAVLRSREFTYEFLEAENILPKLFPDRWNAESGKWQVDDLEDMPTLWDGYDAFDRKVRHVSENRDNRFVLLAIEWRDRTEAADWANKLVANLNTKMRADAIAEAEKSIAYLNSELAKTSVVELHSAIYQLIENQINKIMLANVREEYAFRVLDRAVAPDTGNYFRPKRLVIVAVGIFLGVLLAFFVALTRHILIIR